MKDDIKQKKEKVEEIVKEEVNMNNVSEAQAQAEHEVKALLGKIEGLESQAKRFLADYQNLQRRTQEEKGVWIKIANKQLLLKLLPVLDILLMANQHMQDKGLAIAIDQFKKVLEEEGVKQIKTVDQTFNPESMECISIQTGKEGNILQEVRPGYTIHDEILRPAQVIVGGNK